MDEFYFEQFVCAIENECSIVIEEDERTVYAYFCTGDFIVGDVWLMNTRPAPQVVDWKDSQLPFMNPAFNISPNCPVFVRSKRSDFKVEWLKSAERGLTAKIFFRDEFMALLAQDSRPGSNVFAIKDSPLAKVLVVNDWKEG